MENSSGSSRAKLMKLSPLPRTVAAGNFVFATSDIAGFSSMCSSFAMPIQLCEGRHGGYHASLVENESSSIGSYVDKEPERASFALKVGGQERDSKLTRLLQDSLGGRTKTCIIATVSPAVNQRMMKSTLIKDLYGKIERLKAEVYAVMEKNGVYIPRERYFQEESERKAMADQNEKIGMTIENHQKELQAKYDYQVHQSFDLGKQLDATQNNLNLTSKLLAKTENDLQQCQYSLKEPLQYHASLLENESSAIGSCADEERGTFFSLVLALV
ncbi:Kinesin-like protein KIN-5C [Orobanche minor]